MTAKSPLILSKLALISIAIFLIALLFVLSPVMQPFYIAALLAYLFNPLVDRLEEYKVPRIVGVIIVFVLMLSTLVALGLILIPLITDQINLLLRKMSPHPAIHNHFCT